MPLNNAKNLLFIHIPKCGGSSMEKYFNMSNKNNRMDKALLFGLQTTKPKTLTSKEIQKLSKTEKTEYYQSAFSRPIQHLTPQQLIENGFISEESFRKRFSFAFVRNPWDKVISSYESYFKTLHPKFDLFLLWVKEIVEYEKENSYYVYKEKHKKTMNTHFKEQHKFLTYNGEEIVNFVGRHENIDEDFENLCSLIGVPYRKLERVNATKNRRHYSSYYSEEQAALVADIYKTDIELFNYKFEKNGNQNDIRSTSGVHI